MRKSQDGLVYQNLKAITGGLLMATEISEDEKAYEIESKKFTRYHDKLEWLFMTLLLVGIITAALDVTIGGFKPLTWFVISFGVILVIICMEVSMIRAFLESRKRK